jgi:hypothetical protein
MDWTRKVNPVDWPCDIYSFVEVAPLLAAKGYRLIVPYLRLWRGALSFN